MNNVETDHPQVPTIAQNLDFYKFYATMALQEDAMMSREDVDHRVANVDLGDPKKAHALLRSAILTGLCGGLSDELLVELATAASQNEEVPPAVLDAKIGEEEVDRWTVVILCECMMTVEGRAEVFEAVQLEQYDRANPTPESA